MDIKKQIHNKLNELNNIIASNLIFTFIKENNIAYSENKNGIFFNISLLDDVLASEFLDYINNISKVNYTSKIDEIIIPEKETVFPKKKEEQVIYKNLEIDELESTILSFGFK